MVTLIAKCPRCRSEVDTGFAADQETMYAGEPRLSVLVMCDDCREYQKTMVNDLYLAADVPNVRRESATCSTIGF